MTITYRGECIVSDIKTIKSMLSTLKDLKTRTEHTNEIEEYLKRKITEITHFILVVQKEKEQTEYLLLDTSKREIVRSNDIEQIKLFIKKVKLNT